MTGTARNNINNLKEKVTPDNCLSIFLETCTKIDNNVPLFYKLQSMISAGSSNKKMEQTLGLPRIPEHIRPSLSPSEIVRPSRLSELTPVHQYHHDEIADHRDVD